MKKYTSMFYWENNKNLTRLLSYRKTFHDYVSAFEKQNKNNLNKLRTSIIIQAPKIETALLGANILPWMDYGSRAGGYRSMSLTHELPEFVKNQFSTLGSEDDTLQKIDDIYLRAIGIYEDNRLRSILNVFNPFLYINALVKVLLLPIFTILDIKPANQDSGVWHVFQIALRIPAYYITVINPLILLLGFSEWEKSIIEQLLNTLR